MGRGEYTRKRAQDAVSRLATYLEIDPATDHALPAMAKATKALVHSFPLWGDANTRGACTIATQSKNIKPTSPEARTANRPKIIASAETINATPIPYAQ